MRWRIVGFKHPQDEISRLYKSCASDKDLIITLEIGIQKGRNLFSIRGFDEKEGEKRQEKPVKAVA